MLRQAAGSRGPVPLRERGRTRSDVPRSVSPVLSRGPSRPRASCTRTEECGDGQPGAVHVSATIHASMRSLRKRNPG